jgi:hypothetical protein
MTALLGASLQRLRVNADALGHLVGLADKLAHKSARKWAVKGEDWSAAVLAVSAAADPEAVDDPGIRNAIRLAKNIASRLGDSGAARLGLASGGRDPSSSKVGSKFSDDLKMAHQRLAHLKSLMDGS